jgi:hypothetical protein
MNNTCINIKRTYIFSTHTITAYCIYSKGFTAFKLLFRVLEHLMCIHLTYIHNLFYNYKCERQTTAPHNNQHI